MVSFKNIKYKTASRSSPFKKNDPKFNKGTFEMMINANSTN